MFALFHACNDVYDSRFSPVIRYEGQYLFVMYEKLMLTTGLYVTHLHETSRMSAEFVFRYGPKCMGGVITDSCFIAFITSKIC